MPQNSKPSMPGIITSINIKAWCSSQCRARWNHPSLLAGLSAELDRLEQTAAARGGGG
jgi:hypothetical protein